jgi:hypothetical protein
LQANPVILLHIKLVTNVSHICFKADLFTDTLEYDLEGDLKKSALLGPVDDLVALGILAQIRDVK